MHAVVFSGLHMASAQAVLGGMYNVVHDKLFTPFSMRPEEQPNAKFQREALLTPASPNSAASQGPAEAGDGLGIFRPAPSAAPCWQTVLDELPEKMCFLQG
eukprot:s2156_g2.t1